MCSKLYIQDIIFLTDIHPGLARPATRLWTRTFASRLNIIFEYFHDNIFLTIFRNVLLIFSLTYDIMALCERSRPQSRRPPNLGESQFRRYSSVGQICRQVINILLTCKL